MDILKNNKGVSVFKIMLLMVVPLTTYSQVNEFVGLSVDAASDRIEKSEIKKTEYQEFLEVETYGRADKNKMVAYIALVRDTLYTWELYLNKAEEVQQSETNIFPTVSKIELCKHMNEIFDSFKTKCKPIVRNKKGKIKVANNQWAISKFVMQNGKRVNDPIGIIFKHRLLQFKCLSLFRNLKQRKTVNSFLKELGINVKYKPSR